MINYLELISAELEALKADNAKFEKGNDNAGKRLRVGFANIIALAQHGRISTQRIRNERREAKWVARQ